MSVAASGLGGYRRNGSAVRRMLAGTARGGSFASGAASSAYALGSVGKTGGAAVAGGAAAVGKAAVGAALSPLRKAVASLKDSYRSGERAGVTASGGSISGGTSTLPSSPEGSLGASGAPPAWAAAMKNRQTMTHTATVAAHTLRSGDGGGSGASVDISQKD